MYPTKSAISEQNRWCAPLSRSDHGTLPEESTPHISSVLMIKNLAVISNKINFAC